MSAFNIKTLARDLVELALVTLVMVAIFTLLAGQAGPFLLPLLAALALAIPATASAAVKFYRDLQHELERHHQHHA